MKNVKEKGSKATRPSRTKKRVVVPQTAIDPGLLEEVGHFLEDAEGWFQTPNAIFEGRAPLDLLGTAEESRIKERIEAAKFGMFS